jgi:hypothetical protein
MITTTSLLAQQTVSYVAGPRNYPEEKTKPGTMDIMSKEKSNFLLLLSLDITNV